jgi:glucosamine kinase
MSMVTDLAQPPAGFLIGVDGGGSGTRAVLARADGRVIGSAEAGPSALGQGVGQAWRHVELAISRAFASARLSMPGWERCALAAGLSGIGHAPWRDAFIAGDPGFAHLVAETDSFTMLLGAHGGRPGAIVAAGTGSVAEALLADGTRRTVGGWGFPIGDEGSGAWLGLQALRHAQCAMDDRAAAGPLAHDIWDACGADRETLQAWCERAGQFACARLAPLVFGHERTDPIASALLAQATAALESLAFAIDPAGRLPLALCGSIGTRLAPRLQPALRDRVVPAAQGPAEGALMLIRQHVRAAMEAAL